MPKGYRHLAHMRRCRMYALKESGLSNPAIARRLGRSLGRGSALAAGMVGVALRNGSGFMKGSKFDQCGKCGVT